MFVAAVSGAPEADPAFAYSVGTPLVYNYHAPYVYNAAPLQDCKDYCYIATIWMWPEPDLTSVENRSKSE